MTRANVAVVVGTRPEVIKLAPVVFALRESNPGTPGRGAGRDSRAR